MSGRFTGKSIAAWQERFRRRPQVWLTYESGEFTGNVYDSRAAADAEVAWGKAHGRRIRASVCNLHNVDLARERWS